MSLSLTAESKWIADRAQELLDSGNPLEPSKEAEAATKQAACAFFTLASKNLNGPFPLFSFNKCLGFVVVPRTKIVLLAVSQDRAPDKDTPLRTDFLKLIQRVNKATEKWVFELARVPTSDEYNTLLALPTAGKDKVEPNKRCIEAALMIALCKTGRDHTFTPQEVSVMAFGGHLWTSQKGNVPINGFGGTERNKKHSDQELEIPSIGWIDIWNPCKIHCAHYLNAMRAIAVSGSSKGTFPGPRSECESKHS